MSEFYRISLKVQDIFSKKNPDISSISVSSCQNSSSQGFQMKQQMGVLDYLKQ